MISVKADYIFSVVFVWCGWSNHWGGISHCFVYLKKGKVKEKQQKHARHGMQYKEQRKVNKVGVRLNKTIRLIVKTNRPKLIVTNQNCGYGDKEIFGR